MVRHRQAAGTLAPALDQFLKVTRSYWPGLFHCHEVSDLPRTNNALEQYFGAHRSPERRATGRKTATAALVLRGSVRLVAGAATRLRVFSPEGILYILRTGTPWRDLPLAYGDWHTIYMRWHWWVERGIWWNILMVLKRLKRIDLQLVFLDSTVVRVHQHAAGAPKKN
jgi:transposase